MKWSNIIFWLTLLIVPIFLKRLYTKVSRSPKQQDTSELTAASGVLTVCVLPTNITIFATGENSVLLVGLKNNGELPLQIFGLRVYIYSPNDHQHAVQDLKFSITSQILPPTYTSTFEYMFTISRSVKGGAYSLVGSIIYAIDEDQYQNTFYNDTIHIIKAHDSISAVNVIVSVVVLVMFYISICVYAYCVITWLQKMKKFQELTDRSRPRQK